MKPPLPTDPLTRAWVVLLLLCAASTLIAALDALAVAPVVVGALILLLSWMKARVILSRYLGLWRAPTWRAGFNWVLGLYCLLLLGLYLVPDFAS
ncbi:nitric oxide reductase F protein [Fluviibacterium sp. DFM31]|uniref:Nitric oxide reductase F protein n=1 Tax=Meridianimarinicoccus marinus TaxID=3231483 RepID=A0ABV3L9Q5_9RHOB